MVTDHIFAKRFLKYLKRAGVDREAPENKVPSCMQCNDRKSHHAFVPESQAHRIPYLNKLTPGHIWRVSRGGPVSKAFTEVMVK